MTTPATTSYETIKAGFPPKSFSATTGKPPNLVFILLCWEHLKECAISFPHWSHTYGHLYLALTQVMYALEMEEPYAARQVDPCGMQTQQLTSQEQIRTTYLA